MTANSSRIVRFYTPKADSLDNIIRLGDENSKTLGHLPHDAYKDYARKNGIVVCKINDTLAGYCLFRRQKRNNQIKIAQLCIEPEFRGHEVADHIINFIKAEFKNYFRGIALNCRRDYDKATEVWKRNHFFPEEEKRSRSKKENYLLQWYFSFNQNNLFNSTTSSKIKVLLDLNVMIKLRQLEYNKEIEDQEIRYLINDDILTEVDFHYAKESLSEINRDDNSQRRIRTRRVIKNFKELTFKPNEFGVVFDKVISLSPPKNENDESDRKQLVECITNNIPFFVTTDINLKKDCRVIEEHFNVTILLPSEFIIKFDQIQNSDSFLPRRIGGASFEIRKIEADNLEGVINSFFNQKREKKKEFKRRYRIYCSEPKTESKVVMKDDKQVAMFAYRVDDNLLTVDFIRVQNRSYKYILFNQLITEIVRTAISLGVERIEVTPAELESDMESLLTEFRFFQSEGNYKKIALNGTYHSSELIQMPEIQSIVNREYEEKILGNEQKYELERVIYPGKVRDLEIQNLIVPIRPYWASQLFDNYLSSYSLFGANEKLLWNRKNVYFRSIRPNIESYPARILWYVSSSIGNKYGGRSKGIVACSYLEGIHIDIPKLLFSQFKNVGIYAWSNILDLSKGDLKTLIKVIEFSDTEVFKNSIPLNGIQQAIDKKHTFQSPLRISGEHFFSIYMLKQ
ncbi:MAG: GNAT family N-acetyltransferase [Bacteroidota bacterium]